MTTYHPRTGVEPTPESRTGLAYQTRCTATSDNGQKSCWPISNIAETMSNVQRNTGKTYPQLPHTFRDS
jgi:hypothetical protein